MRDPRLLLLALPLTITSCYRSAPAGKDWLGPVANASMPAVDGSRYPHLAAAANGAAVMSWLEPGADGGFALRHATWNGASWTPPRTVAAGTDWFINWADFPSVVPATAKTWAAHWLQQKPGNVYSYDVRIAVSRDSGATWSAPMSPHDDGTPTEHGFVALFPAGRDVSAVWLDGRKTAGGHDHAAGDQGAMTLRGATFGDDGARIATDVELDARVCDCCQTGAALTDDGPVVVYRDRGTSEVRDISLVRYSDGRWSEPVAVHDDGWTIDACPVNGPSVDARGREVVIAWFTAPDVPRIRLAYSHDAGRSFAPPIEVASGAVTGRVDVVLLEDGRAVVSWLGQSANEPQILAQPFTREGPAGAAVAVATTSVARSSGFPQMVRAGDGLLFAWTESTDPPRVSGAFATLR
jgi:hypothetical protein